MAVELRAGGGEKQGALAALTVLLMGGRENCPENHMCRVRGARGKR